MDRLIVVLIDDSLPNSSGGSGQQLQTTVLLFMASPLQFCARHCASGWLQVRSIYRVTFPQLAENVGSDQSDHVMLTRVQLAGTLLVIVVGVVVVVRSVGALLLEEDELPNRTPTTMAPSTRKSTMINHKEHSVFFLNRTAIADCCG